MKKVLLFFAVFALMVSVAYGQSWSPTPMVIDVPDQVQYAFNGSNIDIPFNLTGKPGQIYLVVNTKLADANKPVAVTNGFKGWHFVNGIDTTIYVSNPRDFTPGNNKFPWDGHGSEKSMDTTVDSGVIAPGTYSYYLWGFDNVSNREVVNDYIAIGFYSYPQVCKFYPYDDKTGALMSNPLLMGTQRHSNNATWNSSNMFFKFRLGDDPYDQSKIETTMAFGFKKGEVVPDQTINKTTPVYDPHDYNTFYFPKSKTWEYTSTVTKWTHVPGGEAIQDLNWGDWGKITWQQFGNYDCPAGVLQDYGDYLVYNVCGKNPVQYQTDSLCAFPWDDPTDLQFDVLLSEFYQPNAPPDVNNISRTVAEAGRVDKGPEAGQFYMSGDATCLVTLIDVRTMLDGADDPFAADGSGYLVWANSNGDFYGDKNFQVEPANPAQLWSCHTYEPRNFNTQRKAPCPADMNGFMITQLDFAGLYTACAWTQDGTGIGYMKFGDDAFSAGGDNTVKKGFGYSLDAGGQFDGIYLMKAVQAEPASQNVFWDQTNWVAWDSDGGTISNQAVAVEEEAPVAFSVAQNTPNPFNPTTTINFTLANEGRVSIDVFNIAGQKVDALVNDVLSAGSHSVTWDANGFAAGVYFYTVQSGDYSRTMKMTLLK